MRGGKKLDKDWPMLSSDRIDAQRDHLLDLATGVEQPTEKKALPPRPVRNGAQRPPASAKEPKLSTAMGAKPQKVACHLSSTAYKFSTWLMPRRCHSRRLQLWHLSILRRRGQGGSSPKRSGAGPLRVRRRFSRDHQLSFQLTPTRMMSMSLSVRFRYSRRTVVAWVSLVSTPTPATNSVLVSLPWWLPKFTRPTPAVP